MDAELHPIVACPHSVLSREPTTQRFGSAHRRPGSEPFEDLEDPDLDQYREPLESSSGSWSEDDFHYNDTVDMT